MKKIDGRGRSPKAGKGVGRKPLAPEFKKEETRTVSIRLPVSSIKLYGIDGAWLFDAATQKIIRRHGFCLSNLAKQRRSEAESRIEALESALIQMADANSNWAMNMDDKTVDAIHHLIVQAQTA